MNNTFLSNENKSLIWQLLLENNAFENIDNSKFQSVKKLYEDKFNEISSLKNINLTQQNKIVISQIMNDLKYLQTEAVSAPLKKIKINLDKELENKEEEFINLIKRPTPSEIKFNDENKNNDDPISDQDMNNMLNKMMKLRHLDVPEEKSDTSDNSDKSNKHVSFDNNIETIQTISNSDKSINDPITINTNHEDLIRVLNTIISNQHKILKEIGEIRSQSS